MRNSINKVFKDLESTGTKTFSLSDDPPVFSKGYGAILIDTNGKKYIDMALDQLYQSWGMVAKKLVHYKNNDTGIGHHGPNFHPKPILIFKKLRKLFKNISISILLQTEQKQPKLLLGGNVCNGYHHILRILSWKNIRISGSVFFEVEIMQSMVLICRLLNFFHMQ